MATIHTYKETKLNEMGMWIKSTDGGPEIYLDPGQARQLAKSILAQTKPAQRSAPTTQHSAPATRRPTAPIRKSAPAPAPAQKLPNQVTGTVQYVGKSSFTDPHWETYAKDLAKHRAMKKFDDCLKGLAAEGKAWNTPQVTAQHFVNNGNVSYVVRADFA